MFHTEFKEPTYRICPLHKDFSLHHVYNKLYIKEEIQKQTECNQIFHNMQDFRLHLLDMNKRRSIICEFHGDAIDFLEISNSDERNFLSKEAQEDVGNLYYSDIERAIREMEKYKDKRREDKRMQQVNKQNNVQFNSSTMTTEPNTGWNHCHYTSNTQYMRNY